MESAKNAAGVLAVMGSTQSRGRTLRRRGVAALALIATVALGGCYGPPLSPRAEGTLIGGAAGVGGGALVGSAVGSPLAGAAIGGLGGAGLGYLIGNEWQHHDYGYGRYGYGHYY